MHISKQIGSRLLISVSSMVLYAVLFLALSPSLALNAAAINVIPAAVFGVLLGVRGGFLYLLISIPTNLFLFNIIQSPYNQLTTHLLGISTFTLVSIGIGSVRDMRHHNDRMRKQAAELELERQLLKEEIKRRAFAEEKLTHEALHDPLTDLPNRRLFFSRLEHACAWSKRNPDSLCAVMYLDLNKFKDINDSLGHEAGDHLLKQVADRLRLSTRDIDTVARMGGDEFAILLEEASTEKDVKIVAQRIQTSLMLPYELKGDMVESGASIGIVMSIAGYNQMDDILRDADMAMYKAKANGGNQYRIFDVKMRE
ncbi:MAG: GGDEF domain-containing protein [Anaerolineales bacterium]|nr:GGDEF domain-containing protein [Anaerolineales bacterium]